MVTALARLSLWRNEAVKRDNTLTGPEHRRPVSYNQLYAKAVRQGWLCGLTLPSNTNRPCYIQSEALTAVNSHQGVRTVPVTHSQALVRTVPKHDGHSGRPRRVLVLAGHTRRS